MPVFAALKKCPRLFAAAGLLLSLALSACSPDKLSKKDGDAFMDKLRSNAESYGMTLNYQDFVISGRSVILKNVSLSSSPEADALSSFPIIFGTVRFDGVESQKDGSFDVEQIIAGQDSDNSAAGKAANKAGAIIVRDMLASRSHYDTKGKWSDFDKYFPYKVTIKNATYQKDSKQIASLNNASFENIKKSADIYDNIIKAESFTYSPALDPDLDAADVTKWFSSLGYADANVKGNFSETLEWNKKAASLNLDNSLNIDKMGGYSFNIDFGGIAQTLINCIRLADAVGADKNAQADKSQDEKETACQALFKAITVNKAKFVYLDDSLIGRALNAGSKEEGKSRADFIASIKAELRGGVKDFKNQAFAAHVAEQISIFLDNPHSLRITANPPKPVSVQQFFVYWFLFAFNPEKAIDLLNIRLDANVQ